MFLPKLLPPKPVYLRWGAPLGIVMWGLILFYPLLPDIEGRMFPVVTNVAITDYISADDAAHASVIYGEFDKVRACAFRRMNWYLGNRNTGPLIGVAFDEDEQVREIGSHNIFGPWLVFIRAEQFPETTAEVVHRCHPFWITRTQFKQPRLHLKD